MLFLGTGPVTIETPYKKDEIELIGIASCISEQQTKALGFANLAEFRSHMEANKIYTVNPIGIEPNLSPVCCNNWQDDGRGNPLCCDNPIPDPKLITEWEYYETRTSANWLILKLNNK